MAVVGGTETRLSYGQCYGYALGAGFTTSQSLVMAAIALAESTGRPAIVNSIGCVGLWQINPVNDSMLKAAGIDTDNLTDPATNARAAKVIFDKQGLNAWQTYSEGTYRKFLGGNVKGQAALGTGSGPGAAPPSFAQARAAGYTGTPAQYKTEAAGFWSTLGNAATAAIPGAGAVNALASQAGGLEAVGHLANELTSEAFWKRVGLGLVGVVVLLVGLFLWDRRTIDTAVSAGTKLAAL